MKILVGIKHVPDTETKIKIGSGGSAIDPASVSKWIISPFDEYALEQALRFRDDAGEGEVVLVCAGPETAQQTLRQGLAMGADRAVLVSDDRFDQADGLVRARALAAVVKEEDPRMVLLGKYGVGTDEGQTGAMLGELILAVMKDQFERLRDGDRFWYQRVFRGQELEDLERTRLSDIIRRNTTIGTEISLDVFRVRDAALSGPPPAPPSNPIDPDRRRRMEDRFGGPRN